MEDWPSTTCSVRHAEGFNTGQAASGALWVSERLPIPNERALGAADWHAKCNDSAVQMSPHEERTMSLTGGKTREAAGGSLSESLSEYRNAPETLVLAIPRGGVPVGSRLADCLGVELDVFAVQKVGLPGHEELAVGAVTFDGVYCLDQRLIAHLQVPAYDLERAKRREVEHVERWSLALRGTTEAPKVDGRRVILVDDGLSTGSTACAALTWLRREEPAEVVLAVPVGSVRAFARVSHLADKVVRLATPDPFLGIADFYDDYPKLTDDDVRRLLTMFPSRSRLRSDSE